MKRRLTIARSLINRPEVLLLDEPTTGLDPQARHVVWERLFRLKQQGVTLVLTTHYMDEAEQLCDRLVVMDKGLIVAEGSPLELIRTHSTREVAELRFGIGEHERIAPKIEDLAERIEVLPDRILLYAADGEGAVAAVHAARLRPPGDAGPALLAGGRLPAPDRPDPGRSEMSQQLLAGADDRLLGHGLQRSWRGSRDLLVRHAAALRAGDGRLPRRLHQGRPGQARGRHLLPDVRRAGHGRGPVDDASSSAR